jgi:OOP family OmpA-OmpF porin
MMKNKRLSTATQIAVLSLIAIPLTTTAQDTQNDDGTGYLYAAPYHLQSDDGRRGTSDNGRGLTGAYGHPLGEHWNLEWQVFMDSVSAAPTVRNFRRVGTGLDFRFDWREGDRLTPYVLLGFGALRNDLPSPNSDNDVFGNAALGFVTGGLGQSGLRLRGEFRYMRDRFEVAQEGKKNDRWFGLGLEFPLGSRTVERVIEREVEVERVVTETVPARIVDTDNDGVPDQNDRCPGTLAGLATDNVGCASTSPQVVRLDDVNFELNSATLTADAIESLADVLTALRGEPSLRAEIAGHTDSTGSDSYNLDLSRQRAESVVNFLVAQGINRSRLDARGYGETRPQADNSSPAGRAMNRRVEFIVQD